MRMNKEKSYQCHLDFTGFLEVCPRGPLAGFDARPTFGGEVLRADAEQVDDVDVAADVDHDLDLGAQGLELGAVGTRLHHLDGHGGAGLAGAQADGGGAVHPSEGA